MLVLKVKDVARELNVCKQTVRNYIKAGILKKPQRTEGNHRVWIVEDINDIYNREGK